MPQDNSPPDAPLATQPSPPPLPAAPPRPVLQSLRRGVWLVRFGLLLTGAALVFGTLLGVFIEAAGKQGLEPSPLLEQVQQRWEIWRAVVVIVPEMMIVVGAILLSTAPEASKAAPMAHGILHSCASFAAIFAAVRFLWPAAEAPLGDEWVTTAFLYVAGASFAAFGRRIAEWFVAIGGDDDRSLGSLRTRPTWQRLAGWMRLIARVLSMFMALIWSFLGFILLGAIASQLIGEGHPLMPVALMVAGVLFGLFSIVGGLVFPLAIFCLIFESGWLQKKLATAVKEPVLRPLAELPAERVRGASLFQGLLAIGFLALGLWADRIHLPTLPADQPAAALPVAPATATTPPAEAPAADVEAQSDVAAEAAESPAEPETAP